MGVSKRFTTQFVAKYGPWGLVTGASSGIGEAISHELAAVGLNVVLSGRNEARLQQLATQLETEHQIICEVILADMTAIADITKMIKELEHLPLGLFVASAGFGTSGEFIRSNLEDETDMVQVNTLALMLLTHHFARRFAEQRRGGIVLMSSIVGFQGTPNAANYGATKAYVQSLGEGLYHELKPYGVDVLAAAPGPVNSGFAEVANMDMGNALKPSQVALPILKALGKKSTVFPGGLTKVLMFGLRTVPRWGKIRIMKIVMGSMTKHQRAPM